MNQENLDIDAMMTAIGEQARAATPILAQATGERKHAALIGAADEIWKAREAIKSANAQDMEFGRNKAISPSMMDRLFLDDDRIRGMVDGLRTVADQRDPVGEVMDEWNMPSGLNIRRVRTPLGVIGVIFESRPNVTADAAALCLKSGNAAILRAGSEAFNSATEIHAAIVRGFVGAGLPAATVQLVPTRDRAAVEKMLNMVEHIDVIVPRGGKGLVGLVQEKARVPVFAHLEGIVHVYVDADADPAKAEAVVLNSKTRRTGICGAAESLLVHKDYRAKHGDHLIEALRAREVEVRGCEKHATLDGVNQAAADDFGHEFLDAIIAVREVATIDEAIDHIRTHHSQHTDAIITENPAAAETFFNSLDSAILMWNASTQFADGGEFGMGAEIGIATGKLHARGPVGATQLTSFKYLVKGDGTVRG